MPGQEVERNTDDPFSSLTNYVTLDSDTGIVHFKTLNDSGMEKNLFVIYNRKYNVLGAVTDKLMENYDCNLQIEFYSEQLKKKLSLRELWELPKDIGLSKRTTIKLRAEKMQKDVQKKVDSKAIYEKNKNGYSIFIQPLSGKTIYIHIEPNSTIEDMKHIIEHQKGIPPEYQRLIFAGKQLENNKQILPDYNIQHDSTIHMVITLRGGMYHETSGKAGNFGALTDCILSVNDYHKIVI